MSAPAGDPLGSAAEEATRFIDAMTARANAHLKPVQPTAGQGEHDGGTGPESQHTTQPAPECGWCPLCRAVAFVRSTDPELREQVVASATALVLSLRELAESAARPPERPEGADWPHAEDEEPGGSPWR